MEQQRGQGVRMSDIAADVGISRQAVYLHFTSRAELLAATTIYMEEALSMNRRLRRWEAATSGIERLDAYVEFWGNFVPEIYGVARALMADYETDTAAAKAWDGRMAALRDGCQVSITMLATDGMLATEWTREEAVDLFWMMLSVPNWEQLTQGCGWSTVQYVARMQRLVKRTFVRSGV